MGRNVSLSVQPLYLHSYFFNNFNIWNTAAQVKKHLLKSVEVSCGIFV